MTNRYNLTISLNVARRIGREGRVITFSILEQRLPMGAIMAARSGDAGYVTACGGAIMIDQMPELTVEHNRINIYLRGSDGNCDHEPSSFSTYSEVVAKITHGAIVMQLTEFCHSYNITLRIDSDWEGQPVDHVK